MTAPHAHSDPRRPATEPRCVRLRDGRNLAYAQYGDPEGRPVLYFHGIPSCRLMRPDEGVTRAYAVRLLIADRPGFGRSDPKPGRSLLDWSEDATELADALGLDRFAVVGPSGGAPFVAACAFRLGGRITRAAIVGGSGPIDAPGAFEGMALERRIGYLLARHTPWLLRRAIGWRLRNGPEEKFIDAYTRHNPPADQALLSRPDVRAMFLSSFHEALRQGSEAFCWEVELTAKPWKFDLGTIGVPTTVWHGDQDTSTPLAMGQTFARAIPGSTLRVLPGEGHLVFLSRWKEILDDLTVSPA